MLLCVQGCNYPSVFIGLLYQPVQQQYGFHVQNDNMGGRTAPPEFVMPFNRIILDFGGAIL